METERGPFQGVINVIRFNWHFYALALVTWLALLFAALYPDWEFSVRTRFIMVAASLPVLMSLFVSFFVYDLSGFYRFDWLKIFDLRLNAKILNIHAGFDESSAVLKQKLLPAGFTVLDFYDPEKHTEVSVKRARKAYPGYPGTIKTCTHQLPLSSGSTDTAFVIFSAHEIRNREERILFFGELNRVLSPEGSIVVGEHLRDTANFLAYNIGFFHFLSEREWKKTFALAGLCISTEKRINPFVKIFILRKS